jgi:hypothetical protein
MSQFVLAAATDYVTSVKAVVKLGLGTDTWSSDREIVGQGFSAAD